MPTDFGHSGGRRETAASWSGYSPTEMSGLPTGPTSRSANLRQRKTLSRWKKVWTWRKRAGCCTTSDETAGGRRCLSLYWADHVKDIEKAKLHPNATKDDKGRLRVAAATGVGPDGFARAEALIDAEARRGGRHRARPFTRGLGCRPRIKRLSAAPGYRGKYRNADGAMALIDAARTQ